MISNTVDLLDDVYNRQVKKFGETTKEELWRKLKAEIEEYKNAVKTNFIYDSQNTRQEIFLEQADIIILANRLYQEFNDAVAWLILEKMYNFETAKYVKMKWEIVEKRKYYRNQNGDWQHVERISD